MNKPTNIQSLSVVTLLHNKRVKAQSKTTPAMQPAKFTSKMEHVNDISTYYVIGNENSLLTPVQGFLPEVSIHFNVRHLCSIAQLSGSNLTQKALSCFFSDDRN
jgi:hypothetical protein